MKLDDSPGPETDMTDDEWSECENCIIGHKVIDLWALGNKKTP